MSAVAVTLQSLHVYPVKSCAGTSPREADVVETGFDLDRAWMVVDPTGVFVSQRELPRMALVQPSFKGSDMILRAPGMLALHVSPERVEAAAQVQVWNDRVAAFDMGDLCAQWFSDFLGRPLRLARFDPDVRRISDRRWTGALEAENAFQDAFPFLVASAASVMKASAATRCSQAENSMAAGATSPRTRMSCTAVTLSAGNASQTLRLRSRATEASLSAKARTSARAAWATGERSATDKPSRASDKARLLPTMPAPLTCTSKEVIAGF